jgi:hypothetical protein
MAKGRKNLLFLPPKIKILSFFIKRKKKSRTGPRVKIPCLEKEQKSKKNKISSCAISQQAVCENNANIVRHGTRRKNIDTARKEYNI